MAWKIELSVQVDRELGKLDVGDYRLICKIEDKQLLILVLRVGHRREVYR